MFAARVFDMHVCPQVTPPGVPHVGGPIVTPLAPTVLVGKQPAAVQGAMCTCVGPPDSISMGCPTVRACNSAMARTFVDTTVHGGTIVAGCFTVVIGSGAASAVAAACQAGSALANMPSLPAVPTPAEMAEIENMQTEIDNAMSQIPEALEEKEAELQWLQENGGTPEQIAAVEQEISDLNSAGSY